MKMLRKDRFRQFRAAICIAVVVIFAASAFGQKRMIVIGGGKRPAEAMKRFVEWSGGEKARILVVTWASGDPEASFKALKDSIVEYKPASVEISPSKPLDAEKRKQFVTQLAAATGVFFTGGDQNRIMDVLKDEELLKMIRERYAAGVVMSGTSAGAAVMSDPMMTGDADLKKLDGTKVGVRTGLGLEANIIFDQHFLVRQRHNRLFGLMMVNPAMLGIGIDEDMAVLITDGRRLEIVGPTQVMFVDPKKVKGGMAVYFLKAGDVFDIRKRKTMAK
ncbi:MAG: cyanophycinase [Pyrinomonadaceae bacterium]|nr:cyanophycinase [Pyrinomonadaceae bacterium]MBP6213578.1 cyanophycinase [Pyrinomonadaceae bacterium]